MSNDRQSSKPGPGLRGDGTPFFWGAFDFDTIGCLLQSDLEQDQNLQAGLVRISNSLANTLDVKGQRVVIPNRKKTGAELIEAFDNLTGFASDGKALVIFDYVLDANLEMNPNYSAEVRQDLRRYCRIPANDRNSSHLRQRLTQKVISALKYVRVF